MEPTHAKVNGGHSASLTHITLPRNGHAHKGARAHSEERMRERERAQERDHDRESDERRWSAQDGLIGCLAPPKRDDDAQSAFREFCASTSLHGWHHLNRNNSHGKAVWLFIVVASLGVASVFLATAVEDFLNRSVVTTIETTTASLQVNKNLFADMFL